MAEWMTPLERVMAAARRGVPDRVPVAPIAYDVAAAHAGVSMRDFVLDPKAMAKALISFHRTCGVDALFVGSDVYYLAEGFGAKVAIREEHVPVLVEPAIRDLAQVEDLRVPDVYRDGRMPVVLECIQILRRELPEVAIVAVAGQATWSCALQVAGMNQFLLEATLVEKEMDEARPELVHRLLELTTQATVSWQKAQIEAGAHVARIGDSSASMNLCSPGLYRKLIHPYHCRIARELKEFAPEVPISKHTCGDNSLVLDLWLQEGVDCLEIDYQMDLRMVKNRAGQQVCLIGNIDPVRTMLQGSPEEVKSACRRAIDAAAEGGGFILGTGCVLPRDTSAENVKAMVAAARQFGVYGG